MLGRFEIKGRTIRVDFSRGESLAIPLDPHGPQPSFYTSEKATAEPLRSGAFLGSVSAGGSCNAEIIRHAPHCHGTHTECIGHILPSADPVQDRIDNLPGLCRLITVRGSDPGNCDEHYTTTLGRGERLVCTEEMQTQLLPYSVDDYSALVIRSLPNEPDKAHRDYTNDPGYPVLSRQAMQWLAASKLLHLLVDMPSLDKAGDNGRLANHRTWWGMDGDDSVDSLFAANRSVTEMIFVSGAIEDGEYWLQLQLSPLVSDACSSRPMIYPLVAIDEND